VGGAVFLGYGDALLCDPALLERVNRAVDWDQTGE
jgi:hypothetical protein